MKTIDTVPQDIEELISNGKVLDEANIKELLSSIEDLLRSRLKPKEVGVSRTPTIRMSKLGTPNRKLWFEFNRPELNEQRTSNLKFLYGDIIERLIIFFLKESGHKVEHEQKEFTVEGIVGHQDCKVDGVTTDIKSTSNFSFAKFAKAQLFEDDPFGYIAQISSYMFADQNDKGAFLAVNKETGQICVLNVSKADTIDTPTRIREVKEVVKMTSAPVKKCYEPVPEGTSGNMIINKNCSYCPFKKECWREANNGQGLRVFDYASGPKYFTEVVNTPRVQELKMDTSPSLEDQNKEH